MSTRTLSREGPKDVLRTLSPIDLAALGVVGVFLLSRIPVAMGYVLPAAPFFTFLALIALVYLLVRLILLARRRLLWRLRNRLIVAYLFIAVIPILLLLTMVGLAGYLLELQIGAHLLRDDLNQRENMIAADASAIAGVVAREPDLKPAPPAPTFGRGRGGPSGRGVLGTRGGDRGGGGGFLRQSPQTGGTAELSPEQLENMKILTRPSIAGVIAAAEADWPDAEVQLNVGSDLIRDKASGKFAGLVEFGNRLVFASVQVLPVAGGRNTIFVAAPVTPALLDSFPSKLGPIELQLLAPATGNPTGGPPLDGERGQNGPPPRFGTAPNGTSTTEANPDRPAGPAPGPNGSPGPRNGRGRGPNGPRQPFQLNGTNYYIGQQINSTNNRTIAPRRFVGDISVRGSATFEALRVQRRNGGAYDLPVLANYAFRLSSVNGDLLTSLGDFVPLLTNGLFAALFVFLFLELLALAIGIVVTRTMTQSVANLYDATVHVRSGDFGHRIHIERQDQLGALAESFNGMTDSVSELIEEQRQRQKLENEVSIAREVQRRFFPKKLPVIPGLELAAICRPARSVSGDYYDIIPLGDARVGIALADISGKGIFASLLMASLQAALRSVASMNGMLDTARVVERLNEHLLETTSEDHYATLFYGVYDTQTRVLNYTNAGHLPPLLVTNGQVQTLNEGGTVIGLIEGATYKQGTVDVPLASLLLVFSDGLTEPENVFAEEFGIERLQEELLRERYAPASKLAESLIDSAERWSGTAEQADDMTVIIARMA
jgi:serine phosphatase RsbU (regulator of sigma subunit)